MKIKMENQSKKIDAKIECLFEGISETEQQDFILTQNVFMRYRRIGDYIIFEKRDFKSFLAAAGYTMK